RAAQVRTGTQRALSLRPGRGRGRTAARHRDRPDRRIAPHCPRPRRLDGLRPGRPRRCARHRAVREARHARRRAALRPHAPAPGATPMTDPETLHDYLGLSRGQWRRNDAPEAIQAAIDDFYAWLEAHIEAGHMRTGQRLAREGATISARGIVTDGP